MKRSWHFWLLYAVCLAVALPALGWLTMTALGLERAELSSRQNARREEKMRLASWRIDSMLMPIIAAEGALSYDDYRLYLPNESQQAQQAPQSPPPLPPYVEAYFEIAPDGGAFSHPTSPPLSYVLLVERLPREMLRDEDPTSAANQAALDMATRYLQKEAVGQQAQAAAVDDDFLRRQQSNVALQARELVQKRAAKASSLPPTFRVQEGVSRPIWVGDDLLVAHRVIVGGKPMVQGSRLDWDRLRRDMRAEVADLLPEVSFVPVRDESGVNYAHALAALPVQLVAPEVTAEASGWTPLGVALVVGWTGLILGAVAAAALLAGVISLSERRAAFVSAVTHELRTPLTTLRMYSEMLDAGMVEGEAQRKDYLGTLRREADRLWHLVENVLAYARLERGRVDHKQERLTLSELWSRTQPRLAERVREAHMELALDMDASAYSMSINTDPGAVEQILFNLVDNACKYAASAATRTIHVQATADKRHVEIRVRDHGAGIRPSEERRLFRPFSKTADQAARSAPGVGLGLALCRRLARQMSGDLRYERSANEGATFLLRLPRA